VVTARSTDSQSPGKPDTTVVRGDHEQPLENLGKNHDRGQSHTPNTRKAQENKQNAAIGKKVGGWGEGSKKGPQTPEYKRI
jgi:hypothetical protein